MAKAKKKASKKSRKKVTKKKATKKKVAKKKATKKKVAKKKVAKKKATKKKVAKKKATKKKVTKKKATKKKVAKKKAATRTSKRSSSKPTTKKASKKKTAPKKVNTDKKLHDSILELIKETSTKLPDDVSRVILDALTKEQANTSAHYAMQIIEKNMEIARNKTQPLCQDTGTILFFVGHPKNFDQKAFTKVCQKAVVKATEMGYLRQNSVNSLTGENNTMNIGPGHPYISFHQHDKAGLEIKLMLKGGGCENVSTQYKLPHPALNAGRDLDGVRKVILEGVVKAQGKGCGPGILGVCIGGDRGMGYTHAKKQLLRPLDDTNPIGDLAKLEKDIVESANKLGIGPMGFGGNTTLLGTKIGVLNRLPASFYVSISYMCWAYRRKGIELKNDQSIKSWLY